MLERKSQVWPEDQDGSPSKQPAAKLAAVGGRSRRFQRSASTVAHQQKFHYKGRQAAVELCKLYAQIHLPVAIVAGWMCFYYAIMSFVISRRLCKDAVNDTPVSTPAMNTLLVLSVARQPVCSGAVHQWAGWLSSAYVLLLLAHSAVLPLSSLASMLHSSAAWLLPATSQGRFLFRT